jgi:hypothetical protein
MGTAQLIPPLMYTDDEIVGYIPSGWNLVDGTARWDGDQDAFRFTVLDGSDLDWEVSVAQAAVAEHGRMQALHRAVDQLERKRFDTFL